MPRFVWYENLQARVTSHAALWERGRSKAGAQDARLPAHSARAGICGRGAPRTPRHHEEERQAEALREQVRAARVRGGRGLRTGQAP